MIWVRVSLTDLRIYISFEMVLCGIESKQTTFSDPIFKLKLQPLVIAYL